MKKLFLALALSAASLFATQAQMTLVKSFDYDTDITPYTYKDGTKVLISYNWECNIIRVYNTDFSLKKTITLTVPNFAELSEMRFANLDINIVVSSYLFNDDALLEFVVDLKNPTTGAVGFAVVNENSEVLFSKYADVKYTNVGGLNIISGTQYVTSRFSGFNGGSVCQTDVYTVPGTEKFSATSSSTSALKSASIEKFASAYPNPASDIVKLPYTLPAGKTGTLEVYNLSGILLKSFTVDGAFPVVELDVTSFQSGNYVYNVVADGAIVASNKFMVSK